MRKSFFFELTNRKRVDMLREVVASAEKDPAVKERILFALRAFDVCTDNRNTLSHAVADISSNSDTSPILKLSKRRSKNINELVYFDVPLADLRGVADEIAATFVFILMLGGFMKDRSLQHRGEAVEAPVSLPKIPAAPQKLVPAQGN